jgi:uncharacterized protein (TIGR02444 family)
MKETLWSFSLRVYALPGVAPACLRCQDDAGADVNVILFLLWQAVAGRDLTDAEIRTIDGAVSSWRVTVVQSLRQVRRQLKDLTLDQTGVFRNRVKALELEAERLEQETLEAMAGTLPSYEPSDSYTAAVANVGRYEQYLGKPLPVDAVSTMIEAVASGRR